jgi:hypothetical protein
LNIFFKNLKKQKSLIELHKIRNFCKKKSNEYQYFL